MKQAPNETFVQLTTQPVETLIPRLAGPCMVSMMVTAIYNMADTFFVGQLNDNAASGAVGVVFSLMVLIQAVGFFFGQGSGNFISRELGKQHTDQANAIATTGLYLSLMAGVVLCGLGLIFSEPLVYMMGATATIAPHAQGYLFYILIGSPLMIGSYVLNNQLRYQGQATLAMVGIAVGSVLNIALDPLFIFVAGMGVSGAALATCISQGVSFVILLVLSLRSGQLRYDVQYFRPTKALLSAMVGGGLPSLGRQGLGAFGTICLNQAAGPYGDAAIAAISVVGRIVQFGFSAMIGFGQGFQPVCGYNFGAGLYSRVCRGFWYCVKSSLMALILLGAVGWWFAPELIALFRDDPEVIAYGTLALRCQCVSFVSCCWIVPTNMMLQTIGRTVPATVVAMARQGLLLIPIVLIMSHLVGLNGILISQALSDVGTMLLSIPLQWKVLKELQVPDKTIPL